MIVLSAKSDQLDEILMMEGTEKVHLRQPFSVALKPFQIELLHCNNHALSGSAGQERMLIYVTLEHTAETSLAQNIVSTEIASGCLQIAKSKGSQIRTSGCDFSAGRIHASIGGILGAAVCLGGRSAAGSVVATVARGLHSRE